jgi:hypothetical protein
VDPLAEAHGRRAGAGEHEEHVVANSKLRNNGKGTKKQQIAAWYAMYERDKLKVVTK